MAQGHAPALVVPVARTGPEVVGGRRVALYSHDAQGLGHVRRNLALAAALVAGRPGTEVLLLTGAPEATTLPLPPHTDVVTLPTVRKDDRGQYVARHLSSPVSQVLALRAAVLEGALVAFAPDLLVVDKLAVGLGGELRGALAALRGSATRTVLGLREVLDAPDVAHREWHASGADEAVRDLYDAVWVYGDPTVYDVVAECGLGEAVAAKTSYTGYLGHGRGAGATARTRTAARPGAGERPYHLCLVGGGQDGRAIAEAFVRAPLPEGHDGVLLTGPYMRRDTRDELRRLAAGRDDLRVLEFVPEPEQLLAGAASVVSMAGYNTVCELLAAGHRPLLVPRVEPRTEQLIRARTLAARGLVDVLLPDQLGPDVLGAWLARSGSAGASGARPVPERVDLDGLDRVCGLADRLLAEDWRWARVAV